MSPQMNPRRDPAVTHEEPFASSTFLAANGHVVQRLFVTHSHDPNKKIELFWMIPEGTGPWPVCLFIHGHQWDPPQRGRSADFGGALATVGGAWLCGRGSLPTGLWELRRASRFLWSL